MVDYITRLILDEGLRLFAYRCPAGKLTIGIGRNLDDRGITKDEAIYLAKNDIRIAQRTAGKLINDFDGLSDNQKIAIVSMAFQLGETRFSKFKKTIAAINAKDFETAAVEMLNSKWAKQTPERANQLSILMKGI